MTIETVDFPLKKMVDLSIAMLNYQRVNYDYEIFFGLAEF